MAPPRAISIWLLARPVLLSATRGPAASPPSRVTHRVFHQARPLFRSRSAAQHPTAPRPRPLPATPRQGQQQQQQQQHRQAAYSTVVVHSGPRSRLRRTFSFLLIASTSFLVGAYISLTYAPPILTPLIMGSLPTDVETLAYEAPDEYTREIDEHIRNCPLAQELRANPDFVESRPHLKFPAEVRQHNLTAGTLAGPGRLAVPPLMFNEKDGKSLVCIFYVGADLSGHPGIVHGGFLATMLDEGLARCVFPALPNKVGVTANLNINYRKPTLAGQFLVLKATTTKVEGRKAWSEGWIESLDTPEADGDGSQSGKLVEASALFVEPKHAQVLKMLYKAAT